MEGSKQNAIMFNQTKSYNTAPLHKQNNWNNSASPWKKVDLEKINPKCLHDPADSYPAFCRKWIHLNSPRLTIWYNGQLVVNETANWSPYHWTGPQVDSQKALQAIWKALNQKYPYEQHALNWKTNWIRSEKLFVGEASRLSFEWATWTLRMEADHSIFCSSLKKLFPVSYTHLTLPTIYSV